MFWLTALLSPGSSGAHGAELPPSGSEYQVKAVFLFNFTHFVEWPKSAFAATNAPLTIGIVGEDPFKQRLEEVVQGEEVHGHPLQIKRLTMEDDLTGCQLLFFSRAIKDRLAAALRQVRGRPILTVGDTSGMAERGVMINLPLGKDNIKMEINLQAARQNGLTISSKLLRLARIVGASPEHLPNSP